VPVFFISIPPDKEPLQSVLSLQRSNTSTLHDSVCANDKAGNEKSATMMHKNPIIKLYVFLGLMCYPHLSIEFFFMPFAKNKNPPPTGMLIEVYFNLLYDHYYCHDKTLAIPFFMEIIICPEAGICQL